MSSPPATHDGSGRPWVVPAPLATAEIRTAAGAPITLRRYGKLDGRRIISSHGNGFAIDACYPFSPTLKESESIWRR